ncbi:hypothetical protein TcasGA2_TC000826 [Tribolium castaneum]|uniref:Uncharacterized protein n=1 Tax=Tribolium castaneum TaxID=7070 RepID=D6W8J9_TRICA|nr:hypothetical protein TcasGA2_TC000826 [Tribolium castaneum]
MLIVHNSHETFVKFLISRAIIAEIPFLVRSQSVVAPSQQTPKEIKLNRKNLGAPYKANSKCAELTLKLRSRESEMDSRSTLIPPTT